MLKQKHIKSLLLASMILFGGEAGAVESLTIAGTGDSQSLLRTVATFFEKRFPQHKVSVPDSVGSGGGVDALILGKVSMARTARALTDEEINAGNHNGDNQKIHQFLIAYSPVVFATHNKLSSISNLTSTQILQIYSGEVRDWNELRPLSQRTPTKEKIYPINREEGDSSRTVLEQHIPEFELIDHHAKIFFTTPQTAAAIREHRQTIGFLPNSWAQQYQLTVLTIDGVPLAESKMVTPLYLVIRGALNLAENSMEKKIIKLYLLSGWQRDY